MIKYSKILSLSLALLFVSCMSTEEKKKAAEKEGNALISIKSKLLKGAGDALKTDGKEALESATEGIGEVIKGITTGYDKSINQAVIEGDEDFLKTFELGRSEKIYSDTSQIKKVTVYLISKEKYSGTVKMIAFDESEKEIGRSKLEVKSDKDDAGYYYFAFDNRTPLL